MSVGLDHSLSFSESLNVTFRNFANDLVSTRSYSDLSTKLFTGLEFLESLLDISLALQQL